MLLKSTKHEGNFSSFDFKFKGRSAVQKFFICSDIHFDNPKCDRKLLFKHWDKAVAEGAYIIITGDLFCLMQGKYDRRASKSAILPEHTKDNYIDLVISDTAEKFAPYAKNILFISRGNHETAVSYRLETDIMERFIERMNLLYGTSIKTGNYTGYYRLRYNFGSTRFAMNVAYCHGLWGGIITKGVLSVSRFASMFPQADVVFSGHTHDGFIVPEPRYFLNLNASDKVQIKNQWHVKTGTYKREFKSGKGWAVEKIGKPKYIGACWMTVNAHKKHGLEYTFELTF